MEKEKSVSMSIFDHLVFPPKEMLKVLKKEGLDTNLPFKAFFNGDKGIIYVGQNLTGV